MAAVMPVLFESQLGALAQTFSDHNFLLHSGSRDSNIRQGGATHEVLVMDGRLRIIDRPGHRDFGRATDQCSSYGACHRVAGQLGPDRSLPAVAAARHSNLYVRSERTGHSEWCQSI